MNMNIVIPKHLEDILKVECMLRDDGSQIDYIKRVEHKLIKNNMKQEFDYILTSLLPKWKEDCVNRLLDGAIDIVHYDEDSTGQLCICTKDITRICIILHKGYNTRIQVGIDCIEKINPELYKKATTMERKYKKQKNLENEYRKCDCCDEYKIKLTEPIWKKDCINCYKLKRVKDNVNTNNRSCLLCKNNILGTNTDWKKYCYNCYKATKINK